ncbi:MAG: desulfoferrodoxin family protein [Candidatus Aenigmatarchaeota archaeon]
MVEIFRTEDWKKEKHMPVIEVIEREGDVALIRITVGKEIPHPNTTEHHIKYIELLFLPDNETFVYNLGRAEFNSHGESTKGPNTSEIYVEPIALFKVKLNKKGTLIAIAYCNIHGLWKNEQRID